MNRRLSESPPLSFLAPFRIPERYISDRIPAVVVSLAERSTEHYNDKDDKDDANGYDEHDVMVINMRIAMVGFDGFQ